MVTRFIRKHVSSKIVCFKIRGSLTCTHWGGKLGHLFLIPQHHISPWYPLGYHLPLIRNPKKQVPLCEGDHVTTLKLHGKQVSLEPMHRLYPSRLQQKHLGNYHSISARHSSYTLVWCLWDRSINIYLNHIWRRWNQNRYCMSWLL
jgi:hypothetical protein